MAAAVLAAAIPFLFWSLYVASRTPSEPNNWLAHPPFAGIVAAFLYASGEPARLPMRAVVVFLNYAACCGMALAIGLSVILWLRRRGDSLAIAALLFALVAIQVTPDDLWIHVFGYGRILSPMLLLLALHSLAARRHLFFIPLLLVLPRVLCQFAPQALGIVRGVFG